MTLPAAIVNRLFFAAMLFTGIMAAVEAGGGLLVVILICLFIHFARKRWPGSGTSGGRAHFASESQVRAAEMTQGRGLHLGELVITTSRPTLPRAMYQMLTAPASESIAAVTNFHLALGASPPRLRLWASSSGHGSIVAATRSGKGAGLLLPTLLTYPGPIVCLDPKAEMYRIALRYRQYFNRQVYCMDPYGLIFSDGGCRYNPFDWVDSGDSQVPSIARDYAFSLVKRTGQEKEPFFNDASELLIQAITAAVLWGAKPEERNLAGIADIIANEKFLTDTLHEMRSSDAYGGVLRTLGNQCAQLAGREKTSVLMSISAQHLAFLASAQVRRAVSGSDFDPLWLKNNNADLFICIPPDRLLSAAGYTRFLLTGILKRLASGPPDEYREVLVILDESATLGRLDILEQAVTLMAGWGVKIIFVWQSIGQIHECFPGDKMTTFMANMSLQVYGKTNDIFTSKHISECLGNRTTLSTNVQHGNSYSHNSGSIPQQESSNYGSSWSVTRSEASEPLMRPEDILKLPAEYMIVMTDKTPPILVRQRRFYEKDFWNFPRRRATKLGQLLLVIVIGILLGLLLDHLQRPK